MSNVTFDPEHTLTARLSALTPRETMDLGIDLCAAVESRVGATGCHGGVWPGNISRQAERTILGDPVQVNIKEMSPDALEYIAPEQFWNGESSPAADVYAIGLVLYTALNGGVMPFFEGDRTSAEARAAALQSRMRGKALTYPRTASRELGDVVLKAIAFRKEDRYPNPAALRSALQALPEGAAVPAAVPVLPLTKDEVKSARSYKVDKEFEKTEPAPVKKAPKPNPKKEEREQKKEEKEIANFRDPKSKPTWLLPLAVLAVAIIALVLALKSCGGGDDELPVTTPEQDISQPTPSLAPTPVPTPSAEPTPTPTPEATPAPLPSYELVFADVSWEEAKAACEAMGGHLATVKSDAEMQAVISLMEQEEAKFCWLGAYRSTADNQWYYVTGEPMTYGVWDTNEPSAFDGDGTAENYLLMWHSRSRSIWCFNDTRNDPVSLLPATYSGFTAYICQFD